MPLPSPSSARVAVVTGANKGIGYFIALQLGLSGLFSDVIIGCRDAHRGTVASRELQEIVGKHSTIRVQNSVTDDDVTCPRMPPTTIRYFPLTIGDVDSHSQFCQRMEEEFGMVDVLVNNAGFAYKGSDPTPFRGQTQKTLEINYFGLVDFTETMLPLLRKASATRGDARIVNVASMAGRLGQVSSPLQAKFTAPDLTIGQLNSLMTAFHDDVQAGVHQQNGWSNSNYGMSKLGVIAATKIWARREAANGVVVNACCPGYCATDMSSFRGPRSAEDGAKNAVLLATMANPPTGEFFQNLQMSTW